MTTTRDIVMAAAALLLAGCDDGNGYYGTGFELIVEGPAR